jgi:DNA integrity scanning protein DisA with diadenylate cyclase activity
MISKQIAHHTWDRAGTHAKDKIIAVRADQAIITWRLHKQNYILNTQNLLLSPRGCIVPML